MLALTFGVLFNHFSASAAGFTFTGSMNTARQGHTATLLPNGKVLVVGGQNSSGAWIPSAELYDPDTGTWTFTGSPNTNRVIHTATLLPNGKVLVAGFYNSSELYDPATETWTYTGTVVIPTGSPGPAATLLLNGKVLSAGGTGSTTANAELYDPATGAWTLTGSEGYTRRNHTVTLLANGQVLVAGTQPWALGSVPPAAALYDPATGQWMSTGVPNLNLALHTATLLPDGRVLVTGGIGTGLNSGATNSVTAYDPASGTWTAKNFMATKRSRHTATLLPNGQVLVVGGYDGASATASAELYNPATGTWSATGGLNTARMNHTATLLPNGKVLVAGGYSGTSSTNVISRAELYDATDWTATPIVLTNTEQQPGGAFQFTFPGNPNGTNTVLATTNVALPVTDWTPLGSVGEIEPGLYWFTDSQATNYPYRFYQVRSP